jgi:NitT/TauT family transport system substrate-binding protein
LNRRREEMVVSIGVGVPFKRWLALVVVGLSLLAACGGDGDGGGAAGGGGDDGGPVTLNVGVIPIADVAPLYLGMDQGFFEAENLTIEPQLAEGGAAIVPAVVSGDYQIGFSNTTSLIIGATQNVPVQIISQGVLGAESPDHAWDAVLVSKDSDIRSPQDLEGKTIAVNTLQNIGPLTINTALRDENVDYTKVKYVEVPFPEMNAALDAGRVDAIWVVEPFVSQGLGAGARAILTPYEQTAPSLTVATYFASTQYIEENGDIVDRFVRAMNKSLEYAQAYPNAVRDIVLTYTEIPKEAAAAMTLPQWSSDLNLETIEQTAVLAQEYGFIEEQPDLGALIRDSGE